MHLHQNMESLHSNIGHVKWFSFCQTNIKPQSKCRCFLANKSVYDMWAIISTNESWISFNKHILQWHLQKVTSFYKCKKKNFQVQNGVAFWNGDRKIWWAKLILRREFFSGESLFRPVSLMSSVRRRFRSKRRYLTAWHCRWQQPILPPKTQFKNDIYKIPN